MTEIPRAKAPGLSALEAEVYAARTVSALAKMPAEDRAQVLAEVPQSVHGAAQLVASDLLAQAPELEARVEVLEARIREALAQHDDRSRLDDGFEAGAGARRTLLEVTGDWRLALKEAMPQMVEILRQAEISPAQAEALAEHLELLQDLHGQRDLSQVNERLARTALALLAEIDLAGLVRQAGHELSSLLYAGLERAAKDEGAV